MGACSDLVYLGFNWNIHHHLLQATTHIKGGTCWANLNMSLWLSLFPFATGRMGGSHAATVPTVAYGVVSCWRAWPTTYSSR